MSRMRQIAIRLPESLIEFYDRRAPGRRTTLMRAVLEAYRRKWEAEARQLVEEEDEENGSHHQ